MGQRINALANCVARYYPIGYPETWAFLKAKAGPIGRSEGALLLALELLETSRQLRLAEANFYRKLRQRQKAKGQRTPPRGQVTPWDPPRWHGSTTEAATFALRFWRAQPLPWPANDAVRLVQGLVDQHLTGATLAEDERCQLRDLQKELERRFLSDVFQAGEESTRALYLNGAIKHLRVAIDDYSDTGRQ